MGRAEPASRFFLLSHVAPEMSYNGPECGLQRQVFRFAPGLITTKVSQRPMINETLIYFEISSLELVSRVKPYAVSQQFFADICSDPAK